MKQEKLQLYTLDMKYVRDLHRVDDRVQSVSPQIHKNNRPFVGVVVICGTHKYCIPLDHPKEKHFTMKNDVDFSRIFVNDKLLGVLNFNNMIPVDDSLIIRLNVKVDRKDSPSERAYKILCAKELDWVQKNQDAIIKKANKLYQMITLGKANSNLRKRCLETKQGSGSHLNGVPKAQNPNQFFRVGDGFGFCVFFVYERGNAASRSGA